ncbi:bifunctional P-loop containing nucleoside triphosphate hydrolase/GTP binding domain [Babesia duncani]|uniref:Bifunctional P-loop containing nucleoside triphosphate hydrolase/GTP binding domain n=1 Tax=Babesia duncani TaxID=323732 RepID=A0AAD9PLK0_9APIC|nr:bifunctional P-loop containing nucleoside triphosphate hydrolase/GTP binding domain [Babesia duncani]
MIRLVTSGFKNTGLKLHINRLALTLIKRHERTISPKSTINDFGLEDSIDFIVPGITADPLLARFLLQNGINQQRDITLPKRCIGCGALFQTVNVNAPGYVHQDILSASGARGSIRWPRIRGIQVPEAPEGVEADSGKFVQKKKRTLCQRCYKLQYYKRIDSNGVHATPEQGCENSNISNAITSTPLDSTSDCGNGNEEKYSQLSEDGHVLASSINLISEIATRIKNDSLVIFLIDLVNVEASVVPELYIALRNRCLDIIWVANKFGVLPAKCEPKEVKGWLRSLVRHVGNAKSSHVLLVDSITGEGFDQVENVLGKCLGVKKSNGVAGIGRSGSHVEPRNVYVVGAVNVGKSTFVNRFLTHIGYSHAGTLQMRRGVGGVTRSQVPGTTIDFIEFGLGQGIRLIDTPGIPVASQVTGLFTKFIDFVSVSLTKRIIPCTIQVKAGQTLLIGGIAQISLLEGSVLNIQCFFSPGVTLHVCRHVGAWDVINSKIATKLYPPHNKQDFERMLPFSKYRMDIACSGRRALENVVVSGLGWVALSGQGPQIIEIQAPKSVHVFRRPALVCGPTPPLDTPTYMTQRFAF